MEHDLDFEYKLRVGGEQQIPALDLSLNQCEWQQECCQQ